MAPADCTRLFIYCCTSPLHPFICHAAHPPFPFTIHALAWCVSRDGNWKKPREKVALHLLAYDEAHRLEMVTFGTHLTGLPLLVDRSMQLMRSGCLGHWL